MPIYLPDFDRPLRDEHPWDHAPLEEELVYSVLADRSVLISAASPFKNPLGWRVINRMFPLVSAGAVRFPLDARHEGRLDRYVASRQRKLSETDVDAGRNPELRGYTSRYADDILNSLSLPLFSATRPQDCDHIFRELVRTDAASEEPHSLRGLLHSKALGWGKDEFLAYISERASDKSKMFQRFSIFDNTPQPLIIDGVLKQRVYRRLDDLFYRANSISAGCDTPENALNFSATSAARLRAFARSYHTQNASLHNLIMQLSPSDILTLRDSESLAAFLASMNHFTMNFTEYYYRDIARSLREADSRRKAVSLAGTSLLSVATAEALGILISAAIDIPFDLPGKISSFVIGLLPQLAVRIRPSETQKVFALVQRLVNEKPPSPVSGES